MPDDDTAKALHGMATGTYPFLGKVQPKMFAKGLAAGEIAVGGALLRPFVSPVVAGAALAGFSGALLNMYWNTEGMHEPGDPRPTRRGSPIAKDVWMFGIGSASSPTACSSRRTTRGSRSARAASARREGAAKRQAKKLKKRNKSTAKQAKAVAKQTRAELSKRGQKAASKAQKQAAEAQAKAPGQGREVGDRRSRAEAKGTGSGASDSAAAAAAGAGAAVAVRAPSRPARRPRTTSTSTARSRPTSAKQAADAAK